MTQFTSYIRLFLSLILVPIVSIGADETEVTEKEKIAEEFTEPYVGGSGFRFKVRNVVIENEGPIYRTAKGGAVNITMEILHDCESCGNAVNQMIVGLAGEDTAQVSVWNGKQRSGGDLKVVNRGHQDKQCVCEDNDGQAAWVRVFYTINVPDRPGKYFLRTRYAQDWRGNLRTAEGLKLPQPEFAECLKWWKVDRPEGPGLESTIGVIYVN